MLWLVLVIIALLVIGAVAFIIYRRRKNDALKYVHLEQTEAGAAPQGNIYSVNRAESNFSESQRFESVDQNGLAMGLTPEGQN